MQPNGAARSTESSPTKRAGLSHGHLLFVVMESVLGGCLFGFWVGAVMCVTGVVYVWPPHQRDSMEVQRMFKTSRRVARTPEDFAKDQPDAMLRECKLHHKKKRKRLRLKKFGRKMRRLVFRSHKQDNFGHERCSAPDRTVRQAEDDESSLTMSMTEERERFLSDESVPGSTTAERIRFLRARDGNVPAASAMLENYLDWRGQFDKYDASDCDTSEKDLTWSHACRVAYGSACLSAPPCIAYMPETNAPDTVRTNEGSRFLLHFPARIDFTVMSPEQVATALSLYVDYELPHDSMEKIYVVIDTRAGTDWANIPAPKLLPFIKHAAHLLNDLHPERLEKAVLFPVPFIVSFLWAVVKPFLDPGTADRIHLLSGGAQETSKVPVELEEYLQDNAIEWIVQKRLSLLGTAPESQKQ